MKKKYLAITGGVGGAKLALGLSKVLAVEQLHFAVNTADDFTHLGLKICPDIDTLMYTLSGENNPEQGWGRRGETWNFMQALKLLDEESWFNLGDRDLALHITRTNKLAKGTNLNDVTQQLYQNFSIEYPVWPMTNDPVSTRVQTAEDELSFQHYFVRERCAPKVEGFRFEGVDRAELNPEIKQLLDDPELYGIVLCPSNPYVSIDPMLALPDFRTLLHNSSAPVVAVSPIISGQAIKGPTAKMMQELKLESSALTVAEHYSDFLDGFILDESDSALTNAVEDLGISAFTAQTLMVTLQNRVQLAKDALNFIKQLHRS